MPETSDLQLQHTSDQSITYFLAESIINLLTADDPIEPQHIAEFTAEIRRRNKPSNYWLRLIANHLRK